MTSERVLIVGLGNPGSQYQSTRHNIGFLTIDEIARQAGIDVTREKFSSRYGTGRHGNRSVVLLKPQTFMNRSGHAVVPR